MNAREALRVSAKAFTTVHMILLALAVTKWTKSRGDVNSLSHACNALPGACSAEQTGTPHCDTARRTGPVIYSTSLDLDALTPTSTEPDSTCFQKLGQTERTRGTNCVEAFFNLVETRSFPSAHTAGLVSCQASATLRPHFF